MLEAERAMVTARLWPVIIIIMSLSTLQARTGPTVTPTLPVVLPTVAPTSRQVSIMLSLLIRLAPLTYYSRLVLVFRRVE